MMVLRELAPAKINLYLHIVGKRADGYHELDSLVAFADIHDKIEIAKSEELTLECQGEFADILAPSHTNNIVLRAAQLIRSTFNVTEGAAITLHKDLPVAAGMGGGSADAAATLRLLTRFWRLKPTAQQLQNLALLLGADIPVCMTPITQYMAGIGEELDIGPKLTGTGILLINSKKPVATEQVFKQFHTEFSEPAPRAYVLPSVDSLKTLLEKTRNDLEPCATKILPEIPEILSQIQPQKGCLIARMSGSGGTCFGLFSNKEEASVAASIIQNTCPNWWIKSGKLL